MINSSLALICGFAILVFCAEKFIAAASAIARKLHVSPLLVGLTIVAIGTSLPELLISVAAALNNSTDLILGNAIGSNIANIGLVLGLTALFQPIVVKSSVLNREFPILLLVMAITYYLAWNDLLLTRVDGLLLLAVVAGYVLWLICVAKRASSTEPLLQEFTSEVPNEEIPMPQAIGWIVLGILLMPLSAQLTVWGAVGIAKILGVSDLIIGLSVVALGTSLPELVTALISIYKKEPDIAVGNIIGSNIFNLTGVIGAPAILGNIQVPPEVLSRDYLAMSAFTALFLITAYSYKKPGRITRLEGAFLLLTYCIYLILLYYVRN